jgi:hypothetical protein
MAMVMEISTAAAVTLSADFWHFQENVPRLHMLFSTYFLVLADGKRPKGILKAQH